MKTFIVLALFAAVAFAAPPSAYNGDEKLAETLTYDNNVDVFGYNLQVGTSNGIKKDEEGHLINQGTDNEAFVVRGSYSYVGPDGQTYTVTYTADQNGFQPQGAHIPQ